jgi:uncharacterized protein (TIGR02246 family)
MIKIAKDAALQREVLTMRSVWIISIVAAMGLATPASAQQVDQNTRQQIEQINAAFEMGYSKQDAAGIASQFAKDGVLIVAIGKHVYTGPQEIEQFYQGLFKMGFNHDEAALNELTPLGTDMLIGIGEYHASGQGQSGPLKADGHFSSVYVPEGGAWKTRLLTASRDVSPARPQWLSCLP